MIDAGPSSPLYLAGAMHRDPGHTRVACYQVQWHDEKWGWRTDESFEVSYDHQQADAYEASQARVEALTRAGRSVRVLLVAVLVEATIVGTNAAARVQETKRQKFLADYEREHPKEKP